MDDLRILENLFEKHNDEIHFNLFKESNIIEVNNNNKESFSNIISFKYSIISISNNKLQRFLYFTRNSSGYPL